MEWALLEAASQGNIKWLTNLLAEFPHIINKQDRHFRTGLMKACIYSQVECVKHLISNKAYPDLRDCDHNTALLRAIDNTCRTYDNHYNIIDNTFIKEPYQCIELLLQYGANSDLLDLDGNTALIKCCIREYNDYTKLLLKYNVNVNIINPQSGQTALMYTSYRNNYKIAKLLLSKGAIQTINHKDIYGQTALIRACQNDSTESIRLIIDSGADLNLTDEIGIRSNIYIYVHAYTLILYTCIH